MGGHIGWETRASAIMMLSIGDGESMGFKQALLFLTVFMFLHGCASQETYHAAVNSWIGSSKNELMRSWGKPAESYVQGSSTYLIYNKSGPGSGDMGYKENIVELGSCTTTFEVADDTVISTRFDGQGCRARTELP